MQKPRALLVAGILACTLIAGGLKPASAIPVFARKYGFDCTMCHVQFPRLNDFGQRYRDNGYQIPGQEDMDQSVINGLPPIAFRTSVGYVSHTVSHTPDDSDRKEFNVGGLDVLTGGLIHRDVGFFGVYTPRLDPARGGDTQVGRLEMMNVVFNQLGGHPLDLRVGRFEAGYLGFSAKRSYTFSPYEVYDFPGATGGAYGGFVLGDTQEGLELSGHFSRGWHGYAGWVNGSQNHGSDNSPQDIYARVYKVFGPGEGQSAGQRLGLMAYHGKARPGDLDTGPQYNFSRLGADLALNLQQTHVMAQYIKGSDDGGFLGGGGDYDWHGGFVEVDQLIHSDIVGFGRYGWVDTPSYDGHDIEAWVLGGRWYLEMNLALHLEYADRRVANPGGPDARTRDLFLRLDTAF